MTVVVSVDPAFSQAYDHVSLAAITVPVQLINLGITEDVPAAINAGNLVSSFAKAEIVNISQATHFSFLGECTMIGSTIIAASGEGPICSETGSRKRRDIHAELKTTIGTYLAQHLLD